MKRTSQRDTKIFGRIAIAVIIFVAILAMLMAGKNIAVLNPTGLFAQDEYHLIVLTVSVMLAVLVPTMIVLYSFAWRYHESNGRVKHSGSNAKSNKFLFLIFWGLPILILIILGSVMWSDTHEFTPDQTFSASQKPLEVQVVGLQWKWLFIYPEQDIATVNYARIPANRPVHFQLTADQMPMSSFWIPNLGGMLYIMTGHVNQLNLMATKIGTYPGKTAEINGDGYAGMQFNTDVTSQQDFQTWVSQIKQSSPSLTTATYQKLLQPSQNNAIASYSPVESNLYASILSKYDEGTNMSHDTGSKTDQTNKSSDSTDSSKIGDTQGVNQQ